MSLAEEVAARKAQRRSLEEVRQDRLDAEMRERQDRLDAEAEAKFEHVVSVPRDNIWRVAARSVIEVNHKALERLASK